MIAKRPTKRENMYVCKGAGITDSAMKEKKKAEPLAVELSDLG